MKKLMYLSLALVLALGLGVSGAFAYDFNDTTLAQQWNGHNVYGPFVDVIGDANVFDTFGANLTNNKDTFTIFTNWNPGKNGDADPAVRTADLFLDFGCNGTWDFAIELNSLTGAGKVFNVSGGLYQTSEDIFASKTSLVYGGRYDVSDDAHKVPVLATGNEIGTLPVTWTYGAGNLNNQVAIDFSSSAFPDEPVCFIWGTATCSNDVFSGSTVPLPPSVLLFGSSLLGLGLLRLRRRSEG